MTKENAARLEGLGLTRPCDPCKGAGYIPGCFSYAPSEDCERCDGKGYIITATGEALIAFIKEVQT